MGLLITAAATPANVPDRPGAAALLHRARRRGRRRLALAWGDRGYEGEGWTAWARRELGITIEVIYRDPAASKTFTVLPRRWVIERTNAWISRRRRCARDYERLPAHHEAMVHWAAILQMTRRLARNAGRQPAPTPTFRNRLYNDTNRSHNRFPAAARLQGQGRPLSAAAKR